MLVLLLVNMLVYNCVSTGIYHRSDILFHYVWNKMANPQPNLFFLPLQDALIERTKCPNISLKLTLWVNFGRIAKINL